jgi:hypothetical protein
MPDDPENDSPRARGRDHERHYPHGLTPGDALAPCCFCHSSKERRRRHRKKVGIDCEDASDRDRASNHFPAPGHADCAQIEQNRSKNCAMGDQADVAEADNESRHHATRTRSPLSQPISKPSEQQRRLRSSTAMRPS